MWILDNFVKFPPKTYKDGIMLNVIVIGITTAIILGMVFFMAFALPHENIEKNYYQMEEIIRLNGTNLFIVSTNIGHTNHLNFPDHTFFHVEILDTKNQELKIDSSNFGNIKFPKDKFVLLDESGREFKNIPFVLIDERFGHLDELGFTIGFADYVTFDIPFNASQKYELKLENGWLVCLQNCEIPKPYP